MSHLPFFFFLRVFAISFFQQTLTRFIERRLDERDKIKGQITRDLRRIDEMAFLDPAAYDQLKGKYRRRRTNTKKITILEDMRNRYCRRDANE